MRAVAEARRRAAEQPSWLDESRRPKVRPEPRPPDTVRDVQHTTGRRQRRERPPEGRHPWLLRWLDGDWWGDNFVLVFLAAIVLLALMIELGIWDGVPQPRGSNGNP
jgi:hypothetical protein